MTRKAVFAGAAIAILFALNFWYYAAGPSVAPEALTDTSPRGFELQVIAPLPAFNFPVSESTTPPQASRDLFNMVAAVAQPAPPAPTIEPEPALPSGPNPLEVAMESARVNMLNVRVTGILSSQSGLSAMVNAPFYNGPAIVGTQLGEGIVVSAVNGKRVRISHPELQLQRDINIGE